jgi:uncharacterized metal-binding protein YceD (DUF177 family)
MIDRTDIPRGDKADTHKVDPWRVFVAVNQIPDTGLHRDIEADQRVREAMADIAGLRDISWARASFDLAPKSGDRVHVTGRVSARVGQSCVVTLDPIENDIDEEVDLIFVPAEQIVQRAEPVDSGAESDDAEQPEPIENGFIDLGRLASDVLYLAIDPYPRKEGAAFEPQVAAFDPEDHPFAALKALQGDDGSSGGKKPKGE